MRGPRLYSVVRRRLWGLLCAGLWLSWFGGCATVNPQSTVRLAREAQLTTHAISESLEGTRRVLTTYAEGQLLHAKLSGRDPLAPTTLCSIRAVQRSLRMRVVLLRKLSLLYDRLVEQAQLNALDAEAPIYDELLHDLASYERLPESSPGPTCPDPDPQPLRVAVPHVVKKPPLTLGFSRSASLRRSSAQVRVVLEKILMLWQAEQEIYLAISRQAVQSQKLVAKTLLTRFGMLTPATLFAPQVAGLGLAFNELAYAQQRERLPKEQQAALQEAVLTALEERAKRLISDEEVRYVQHADLLSELMRLHQALELGQPVDLRQVAYYLVPLLGAASQAVQGPSAGSCGCGCGVQ